MLTAQVSYDSLKTREARLRSPENSDVNATTYKKKLDKQVKANDNGLRQIQELTAKAAVESSRITSCRVIDMLKDKDTVMQDLGRLLYDDAFDACCLSSQTSYRINMNRVN